MEMRPKNHNVKIATYFDDAALPLSVEWASCVKDAVRIGTQQKAIDGFDLDVSEFQIALFRTNFL
jgi:hypothetical protein